MKRLFIGICLFTSITSFAKEFTVTLREFGAQSNRLVKTINLPADDVIHVKSDTAVCIIDGTAFNSDEKYSFLSLDLEDFRGNRVASGGLVENGSATMVLSMNNHLCLVVEKSED